MLHWQASQWAFCCLSSDVVVGKTFYHPTTGTEVYKAKISRNMLDWPFGEWNGRWCLKSIYGWLLLVKQIWSWTESWRNMPQAHMQPIFSLDSFQVALAWKQMSNPSNIPSPIHSDNLLLKKMGLINLPIDSGEQVKNTFFNFDNTISIIKRTSLYVHRLCCPHVVFISDVHQASQRQYEYQMEKASWTLNYMSSRDFFFSRVTLKQMRWFCESFICHFMRLEKISIWNVLFGFQ